MRNNRQKSSFVDWLCKNKVPESPQVDENTVLTSITMRETVAMDGIIYLYRMETAKTRKEYKENRKKSEDAFTLAVRQAENSRTSGIVQLNANRANERGRVFNLGFHVSSRLEKRHIPIILREAKKKNITDIEKICTHLYYKGLPVVPLARVTPTLIVTIQEGQNFLSLLHQYNEKDRAAVEQRIWGDVRQVMDNISEEIMRTHPPHWYQPRTERAEMYKSSIESISTNIHTTKAVKKEICGEAKKIIRILARDRQSPFIDPNWRNFGTDQTLQEYGKGKGRTWFYDYDRLNMRSSYQFNMANLVFQPWKHIPMDVRLASTQEHFLEASLYYLTCRVGRGKKHGIPKTGANSYAAEEEVFAYEKEVLEWVVQQPHLQKQFPASIGVITEAAPWWPQ